MSLQQPRLSLKLFHATGDRCFREIEDDVNGWLEEQFDSGDEDDLRINIVSSSVRVSSVSEDPSDRFYPCVVCEIWWRWEEPQP